MSEPGLEGAALRESQIDMVIYMHMYFYYAYTYTYTLITTSHTDMPIPTVTSPLPTSPPTNLNNVFKAFYSIMSH